MFSFIKKKKNKKMINFDLKDRVEIVTGGAQGFGLAITQRFIKSGAKVIIWDIDNKTTEDAVKKINSENCIYQIVDVKNFDQKKVIDLNLNSVFYCCKAVVPYMIKNNYGRIVNIASIAGKEGNPNAGAYSSSKAGVIGLTKSLGKELAQKNIAVNCITPAAAKTRIFDQMTEEHINYMLSKIPRNKFAKVEELASLVAWLSSEENSFSTAAVFDLSGGRATY